MVWVYHDAKTPTISATCRSLGNNPDDRRDGGVGFKAVKLPPGLRVEAMIANILMGRKPLYRLYGFFEDAGVSKMFWIQDNAWRPHGRRHARALGKLTDGGSTKVYGAVALSAASREGADITVLHAGTTSLSVQDAYEDNAEEDIFNLGLQQTKKA